MVQTSPFAVDPDDPRAPSQEQWDQMTPSERERVVASLPADLPIEVFMPEGDRHRLAKSRSLGALDAFFKKIGRKVYVSSELGVYYPGERRFAPDVLAVLDVDPHDREKWVVSAEGKGLDLVIEVHVTGEWNKDYEANRRRYARLGIPEYFLFDRPRCRLWGWRLPHAGATLYEPLIPQLGIFSSSVLGLDLGVDGERLRFYYGTAPLPDSEELVAKLESMVGGLVESRERAEQERERAEQERERAEQERERAERDNLALRNRIAELQAELARLKGG